MENYIRIVLKNLEFKPLSEQKDGLKKLYTELEERGYNHIDIYTTINKILIDNLKQLNGKLNNLLK